MIDLGTGDGRHVAAAAAADPKTFVIEMRDVVAVGFADNFIVDPRVPIAGVRVETSRAFDGASIARVSLTLAQPIRPRVRSSRNVIYVEADRTDRVAAGVIGAAGPSSVIRDLLVSRRGAGVVPAGALNACVRARTKVSNSPAGTLTRSAR